MTAYLSKGESYMDDSTDVATQAGSLSHAVVKIAKKKTINLNALMDSVSSIGQIKGVLNEKNTAYEYIMDKFVNKNQGDITEADYIIGQVWLLRMFNGVMVHPTQATHNAITEKMVAAMRHPRVNKDAVKYHVADRLLTCAKQRKK